MKKVLSLIGVGVLLSAGVASTSSSDEARAAAEPLSFTVDCSSATTLNNATTVDGDVSRVVSGIQGETFTITNSPTAGAACTVTIVDADVLTGPSATTDLSTVTIAAGANAVFTIQTLSGDYRIAPGSDAAVTFAIDTDDCSLAGAGIPTAPFLVADGDDLKAVGDVTTDGCGLDKDYLQTDDITAVDTSIAGTKVEGAFSGTYDGDHYAISYFSGDTYQNRAPLFETLAENGVIERLRLTGQIKSSASAVSSLVSLLAGGVISEVSSAVLIEVDDGESEIGGLVTEVTNSLGEDSSRIQYSKFSGRIDWTSASPDDGPIIGGLIGRVESPTNTEIRDSYSLASISFDSQPIGNTPVYVGGLVGTDGNMIATADTRLRIIRSYFAGSFANTCEGTPSECNIDDPTDVFVGALIGGSHNFNDGDVLVSAFWLSSSATQAVGQITGTGTQPLDYTSDTPGRPEAPGLSSTLLRTKATYQSAEGETSGTPSGDADLDEASSTGSLLEQDYRWAIESGNVLTFVPSVYTSEASYLSRQVFGDTSVVQTYRTRGGGDLTFHDGTDPETVTGYPVLGRVWEICATQNNGYPFLVWEERDCPATGSGASSRNNDEDEDVAAAAAALGLTEEEYAAFLASGLTLEEFLASRLATTGLSSAMVSLSTYSVLVLFAMGGILLWWSRRSASAR